MYKLCVSGGRGVMGKRISQLADSNDKLKLELILERPGHPDMNEKFFGAAVVDDPSAVSRADVVIDFSLPDSAMKVLRECRKSGKSLVIGTTGFTEEQLQEIKKASSEIPLLLAPNMSAGVNLVFRIAREISEAMPEYDKEIVEAHHNRKVDSPSGTAKKIAEVIKRESEKIVYGRKGQAGPRGKGEIGVHAVRGGNITGEHTVMWIGDHERIELSHKASSRDVFASGAIKAAVWLSDKKPGRLYGMQDVLFS